MPRPENNIMEDFDNPEVAADVAGVKADSVSDTIRARVQLEVLLDIRKYLKTISEK